MSFAGLKANPSRRGTELELLLSPPAGDYGGRRRCIGENLLNGNSFSVESRRRSKVRYCQPCTDDNGNGDYLIHNRHTNLNPVQCMFLGNEEDEDDEDDQDYEFQDEDKVDIISEDTEGDTGNKSNKENENPEEKTFSPQYQKIIDFQNLKNVVEGRLRCATCRGAVLVTERTHGFATEVLIECKKGHQHIVEAHKKKNFDLKECKTYLGQYTLNYLAILLSFYLGVGLYGLAKVTGMLGIRPSLEKNNRGWKKLTEFVGSQVVQTSQKCMDENLEREMEATKRMEKDCVRDGRVGIGVSMDAGWQKRGTGRSYQSLSSHMLSIGCYTKGIVALVQFGKKCKQCEWIEKSGVFKEHDCARNYEGSSKGMESKGALEMVTQIWETGRAWVNTVVSDDDSSIRAILKHDSGEKNCKGKLASFIYSVDQFLCDKLHRKKVFGKHLYAIRTKYGDAGKYNLLLFITLQLNSMLC